MLVGSLPLFASDTEFLILSDIHFNPLAQPSQAKQLDLADVQSWESILSESPSQQLSKYGDDTDWALLRSVLNRAANLREKPKFAIVTGDLFAHHLREHYEQEIPASHDFASFAQKTALFLERELKTAMPGVPVIMALGNNDGDCGDVDYSIEPGGVFLRKTLAAIADANKVAPAALEESWNNFGSYDIAHPVLRHERIIVLNTTFLSWRYQNACGDKGDDPGERMLAWLEKRLASAKASGQRVWLVYHIPPGIDGYASTHQRAPNRDRVVTLWNPRYETEFEKILREHAGTVQNQLAGHTHFDDFRLLGEPGAYSGFVLLDPGISPNVKQNPAIREASFRPDGTLTDLKTWYLNLAELAPDWKLGYQFRREWKAKAVNLASLSKLYSQIRASSKVRSKWEQIYSVWTQGRTEMTKRDFAATACATGNAQAEDFRKCFCDADPTAGFCPPALANPSSPANVQSRPH